MKFRVVHVNPGEKLNKNGNYNDIIQKSLVFPNIGVMQVFSETLGGLSNSKVLNLES